MYLTKKEIQNHKIQRKHTGNYVQKCYKTKVPSLDGTGNLSCRLKQLGQMEELAYTKTNDNYNVSIRQPFGLTAPYCYSAECGIQKQSEPIQRKPDKNIIQFTQIVPSENGNQQTKSIFPTAPNVVLGDNVNGGRCALFTRAKLKNGHVMLILEWHNGTNTGNIVEHLIYKEGDENAFIERKNLATEEVENNVRENRNVILDKGVFSLYRLSTSETATFEHKVLTLKQMDQAIRFLDAENGQPYAYALGATGEEGKYDCVSWADRIWDQFQDVL